MTLNLESIGIRHPTRPGAPTTQAVMRRLLESPDEMPSIVSGLARELEQRRESSTPEQLFVMERQARDPVVGVMTLDLLRHLPSTYEQWIECPVDAESRAILESLSEAKRPIPEKGIELRIGLWKWMRMTACAIEADRSSTYIESWRLTRHLSDRHVEALAALPGNGDRFGITQERRSDILETFLDDDIGNYLASFASSQAIFRALFPDHDKQWPDAREPGAQAVRLGRKFWWEVQPDIIAAAEGGACPFRVEADGTVVYRDDIERAARTIHWCPAAIEMDLEGTAMNGYLRDAGFHVENPTTIANLMWQASGRAMDAMGSTGTVQG